MPPTMRPCQTLAVGSRSTDASNTPSTGARQITMTPRATRTSAQKRVKVYFLISPTPHSGSGRADRRRRQLRPRALQLLADEQVPSVQVRLLLLQREDLRLQPAHFL